VHHHQIRALFGDHPDRLVAIRRIHNLQRVAGKVAVKRPPNVRLVIDNQDLVHKSRIIVAPPTQGKPPCGQRNPVRRQPQKSPSTSRQSHPVRPKRSQAKKWHTRTPNTLSLKLIQTYNTPKSRVGRQAAVVCGNWLRFWLRSQHFYAPAYTELGSFCNPLPVEPLLPALGLPNGSASLPACGRQPLKAAVELRGPSSTFCP